MQTYIYDAGALVAAQRRQRTFLLTHSALVRGGTRILVPVPAYVQVYRDDPRQHGLHLLMQTVTLHQADRAIADLAGRGLKLTGTSDAVDAIVAATAVTFHAPVATSDPKDISALVVALGGHRLPVVNV